MSKKASKALIGAFVLGAMILAVAGVVIFGGGKFLKKTQKYVMYFSGSVKGLQVGAPVMFRGVRIGEVTDIAIRVNPENLSATIPVYVEIDPDKFQAEFKVKPKPYRYYREMIEKGLKARLELQSFVTGLLVVGLDFYPDRPIRLVGADKKYHEIPTIPTNMEELTKTIQSLPLKDITEKLDHVLEGVDKIVHSPELMGSLASMNLMLKDIDMLARNVDTQLRPLTASLTSTSDTARGTLEQARKTLAMEEGVPGELSSGLKETMESVRLTLTQTQRTLEGVNQIAAQNANIGYDISRSLEQMTALSRSLRSLADYLDQHPEALIRGKRSLKGE
jgi:paraquat-inducible protein B